MKLLQTEMTLPSFRRGFHIITDDIINQLPELKKFSTGTLHIFLKHTSAGLTINENADPSVRGDLETFFSKLIPDGATYFEHDYEGDDDMPAHIKSSIFGNSLSIPITNGKLNLGNWQGIYLCEFRNNGGRRAIVLTIHGEMI